jgi:hypothetical protein
MSKLLKSYFYWTYPRGNVHYDVMVTLILLFIFVTPQFWNFGDKPSGAARLVHPIQVVGDGNHDVIISVQATDVHIRDGATQNEVKKTLRQAIEPITGDAVFVERWETAIDDHGTPIWKIWAHR